MKNSDVVRMVRQGDSVSDIVAQIDSSDPRFVLFRDEVEALRREGVPPIVIDAMFARNGCPTCILPTAPASTAAFRPSPKELSANVAPVKPEEPDASVEAAPPSSIDAQLAPQAGTKRDSDVIPFDTPTNDLYTLLHSPTGAPSSTPRNLPPPPSVALRAGHMGQITIQVVDLKTGQSNWSIPIPGTPDKVYTHCGGGYSIDCTSTYVQGRSPTSLDFSIQQVWLTATFSTGGTYTLWCQKGFRGCYDLPKGSSYVADMDKNIIWVYVDLQNGKNTRVKYHIVH